MLFLETFKNRDLTLSGRNDALNPCHLACSSVNNWVIRLEVSIYTLLSSLPFQGLTLANIGLELTVISLPLPPEYWNSRDAPPQLMLLRVVEPQNS